MGSHLPRRGRDRRGPEPPPTVAGAELGARRGARLHTAEQFRQGRTPLAVIEVTRNAVALAEEGVREAMRHVPPPPSACREGCTWCCYKLVGTSAPEVLCLVAHLREQSTPQEWEALRERVARVEEQRRGLTPVQLRRRALPCPLLVEGRCCANPVRPLTCRGYNSSDERRCQRSLETGSEAEVPVYLPQQRLYTFVLDGLRAGLEESQLDGSALELTAALRVAVETPDAEARWLAGERVFAPARLP